MRKTLLLLFALCCPLLMSAQSERNYTDDLVVTINGASSDPQKATVTVVDNGDGTIDFHLDNFSLTQGEDVMDVGNIVVKGLVTTPLAADCRAFTYNGSIQITAGNDPDVDFWMGSMLGDVPLALSGKMTDDRLYVSIDIDMMASIHQIIYVKFGTDDFPIGTGITGINAGSAQSHTYDLQGRRLLRPAKGICVVNGRKVIFK